MVRVERGESITKQVYDLWIENPYLPAKKICYKLGLAYKKQGNYVNKLLSEFRSNHDFDSAQKALSLPHKRVFVWESIPRVDFDLVEFGWVGVANRNGMFVFRGDFGSVHWYKGGKVILYLQGALQLARVKELFCRAFSWFGAEEWSRYLDVPLREEMKHWVFELGKPVPRFDIRKFERSHGIRIFADGSHPRAIEVEETQPFWIGEFRAVTDKFGAEIQEHLDLIKRWQEEAARMRQQRSRWSQLKHWFKILGE